jgi:hypothetical protein
MASAPSRNTVEDVDGSIADRNSESTDVSTGVVTNGRDANAATTCTSLDLAEAPNGAVITKPGAVSSSWAICVATIHPVIATYAAGDGR